MGKKSKLKNEINQLRQKIYQESARADSYQDWLQDAEKRIDKALLELGVPNENYPAPIVAAVDALSPNRSYVEELCGDFSTGNVIESAWGIIANVSGGDWSKQSPEWEEAAKRWRTRFHLWLDSHSKSEREQEIPALVEPEMTDIEILSYNGETLCVFPLETRLVEKLKEVLFSDWLINSIMSYTNDIIKSYGEDPESWDSNARSE